MGQGQADVVIEIKDLVKDYKMFRRKQDRLIEVICPFIKKHSNFRAMDNLNLEIRKGEVVGILGKNGAREVYSSKNDYWCYCSNFWKLKCKG